MQLQQSVGNQLVGTWLQPKLRVGSSRDPLEHEADQVASRVMAAQDLSGPISTPRHGAVQRSGGGEHSVNSEFTGDLQRASQGGKSLPTGIRSSLETKMGADFRGVRVHTGPESSRLADSIHARAFTHGRDIYFANNVYQPGTRAGTRLLAHELTHTVQQGASPQVGTRHGTPHTSTLMRAPTGLIQRDESITGKGKLPLKDYSKKVQDVNMRQIGVMLPNGTPIGTMGMGPCCAIIVPAKLKDSGWVVGLMHYSGANMIGQQQSIKEAYAAIHKQVSQAAAKQGTVEHVHKYLVPGRSTMEAHSESIADFEKLEGDFDNDWRELSKSYYSSKKKSSATAMSVTIEQTNGGFFSSRKLKIKYYFD